MLTGSSEKFGFDMIGGLPVNELSRPTELKSAENFEMTRYHSFLTQ